MGRNDLITAKPRDRRRRLPRGGVGRNVTLLPYGLRVASVASLAEAWVETTTSTTTAVNRGVASLAEAWVETHRGSAQRGRKHVASLAEAWVETRSQLETQERRLGRLPRGGVGRNFNMGAVRQPMKESPPSRRRGSKRDIGFALDGRELSPPSRRRGSKHRRCELGDLRDGVASLAEAWVETYICDREDTCSRSRLPRGGVGRNVKAGAVRVLRRVVASLAEAWVETHYRRHRRVSSSTSPPSRRRGSKHTCCRSCTCRSPSPPSRRRGSKHAVGKHGRRALCVASLAEAWVETRVDRWACKGDRRSPPSRRRGSKLQILERQRELRNVASLAEAWVET